MTTDTNSGGNDPANKRVSVSQPGLTGASHSKDIDTMHTVEEGTDQFRTDYSIVASDALPQHDPLEEALQRLDAAYTDAVNMAIAHGVFSHMMTEEEARQLFEQQRQEWQEAKV